MKKIKILVVDPEYHMQNANTLIVNRICRQIENRYDTTICTINSDDFFNSYTLSGNLLVVDFPVHSFSGRVINKPFDYLMLLILKVIQKLLHHEVDLVNSFFVFRDFVKWIRRTSDINYDIVLSFSSPFSSHLISRLVSKKLNIPWIACYFDPFFSNETMNKRLYKTRRLIEEYCLSAAASVIMTYPTDEDYRNRNISFSNSITGCELPGIRKELYRKIVARRNGKYKFVFVGNLYKDIRNPESVIKLFSKLDSNYELSFFGGYYGDAIAVNDVPENVHFHDPVSSDKIPQIYDEADFLVNIGNTITNQMPSKIFEYISTGKPIVNVVKSDNCPTLKYLKIYPLALNLYEKDIGSELEAVINRLKQFCIENSTKQLPFEQISKKFGQNSDFSFIETLTKEIDRLIKK